MKNKRALWLPGDPSRRVCLHPSRPRKTNKGNTVSALEILPLIFRPKQKPVAPPRAFSANCSDARFVSSRLLFLSFSGKTATPSRLHAASHQPFHCPIANWRKRQTGQSHGSKSMHSDKQRRDLSDFERSETTLGRRSVDFPTCRSASKGR